MKQVSVTLPDWNNLIPPGQSSACFTPRSDGGRGLIYRCANRLDDIDGAAQRLMGRNDAAELFTVFRRDMHRPFRQKPSVGIAV